MQKIGILALQGAFSEHEIILNKMGVSTFEVRKKKDLEQSFDGMILPGGESTAIGKLLHDLELFEPVKKLIEDDMPVFGTCAGLIMLAKNINNDSRSHFATMDVAVERNAYGRQLGSFETTGDFTPVGRIPMTFIRAPYITSTGKNVEILSVINGKIVAAREKNQLVTSFHPELTGNTAVHEYFLSMLHM